MYGSEFPEEESLPPAQLELIRQLREEAHALKASISQLTLQGLAISAALLAAIMGTQLTAGVARVGWLSLPLLLFLRAVSRTVVHKLGTINRNHAYELHLARSRRLREEPFGWHHSYRLIGWEEAMRAWRIIQATIFARLCRETTRLRGLGSYRPRYKPETVRKSGKYCWYHVPSLVEEAALVYEGTSTAETSYAEAPATGFARLFSWWTSPTKAPIARYHPGNYTAKMLSLVHAMMLACLAPPAWAALVFAGTGQQLELYASAGLLALSCAAIALWWARDAVRLDLLERGILSIHSCAVMWQAVVIAHYRALLARSRARYDALAPINASNGYTFQVARQAAFLAERVLDIQRWCDGTRDERQPRRVEVELAELDGTPLGHATILNASVSGRGVALAGVTGHDSRTLIGKRVRLRFVTGDDDAVVAAVVKVLYRSSKSGELDHFGCTVAPESRDTLRSLLKLAS